MALPKVVYVFEEKDINNSTYLVGSVVPGDLDKGIVGVYDLRETLHVRHALELRRHGTKQWFKSARKP